MSIESEVQEQFTGGLVDLFVLDTTPIGGTDIFRFTAQTRETTAISFGGQTYTGIPIEADGFEWDGRGNFPTPKLRVANVSGLVSAAIIDLADLVGAKLTRIRTFDRFLDDGASPDPTAKFADEIYTIEQKSTQNKVYVEWVLSSAIDQRGTQIPKRVCLRDRCTHTYRRWDATAGAFVYTGVSCPYTGAASYDKNGGATSNANDQCGRRLSDCKKRFGAYAELPTRAFPGVARTRIRG